MRYFFLITLFVYVTFDCYAQQDYFLREDGENMALSGAKNQLLIPPVYEKLGWTSGLNLPVDNVIGYYDQGWGLISLKNKVITKPKFYTLEAIHKELIIASVKLNCRTNYFLVF